MSSLWMTDEVGSDILLWLLIGLLDFVAQSLFLTA